MRTVSLGLLAAFAGLALWAAAGLSQGTTQGDKPGVSAAPIKQLKLTDKKVQGFIAAQKQLAPLADKLQATDDKADPALEKQVEQIAKRHGFASTQELGDVSANIFIVLAGLDAKTGQFTEPPDQIRKEMEAVKQDTEMSQQQREQALAEMTKALKIAAPVQFKENVALVRKYQKQLDQLDTSDTAKEPESKEKKK